MAGNRSQCEKKKGQNPRKHFNFETLRKNADLDPGSSSSDQGCDSAEHWPASDNYSQRYRQYADLKDTLCF